MHDKITIAISLLLLLFLSGCFEGMVRSPDNLSTLIDTVNALATANVASAPINPYVIPIGVGLSGLLGVIEALRRKERSSRKHAERKLNGNNNAKPS